MHQALAAANKELPVYEHDDGRKDHLHHPDRYVITFEELRERKAEHHVSHREIHEDYKEDKGCYKALFEDRCLLIFERISFRLKIRLLRIAAAALYGGSVARIFNGLYYLLLICVAFDSHGVRKKTYAAGRDTRNISDCLLHSRLTCGAAHSGYVILFHLISF